MKCCESRGIVEGSNSDSVDMAYDFGFDLLWCDKGEAICNCFGKTLVLFKVFVVFIFERYMDGACGYYTRM